MPTSRFLRTATRTVTVTGSTAVGGVTNTAITIHDDYTIRFTDAAGVKRVVPVPVKFNGQDAASALHALVDALVRRAT